MMFWPQVVGLSSVANAASLHGIRTHMRRLGSADANLSMAAYKDPSFGWLDNKQIRRP